MKLDKSGRNHIILVSLTAFLFAIRFNNTIIIENHIIRQFNLIIVYFGIVLLFINSFYLKSSIKKKISGIVFCILTLIGFFPAFFTIMDFCLNSWQEKDYSFECIQEIKLTYTKIKVYRTNGGATTAFGIVVREEKEILPGILHVKSLFERYRMDTVGIEFVNNQTLRLYDVWENNVVIKDIHIEN